MKKSKKIALIMLAVMLMAVCFIFGTSAVSFDDYVNAGVVNAENQTVYRCYLNGCSISNPTVPVYDFESGKFVNKSTSEITEYYDVVPLNCSDYASFPYLEVPDSLYSFGWKRVDNNESFEKNSYYVKDSDAGKIVEFVADVQLKYVEGNFSYIVTDGKATIVKVKGFDDGKVIIPDTLGEYEVAEIIAYAFNDTYKEFSVSESNKYFSVDESGALFNKDKTKIYAYPAFNTQKTYKIPDSVEIIGTCAFMQSIYLKDLQLPENLRIIEEQGIRSAWCALGEIYLSDKVEKLEEAAIYDMPFLKKFYIEGMDTEIIGYRPLGFVEMYFSDSLDKDYCADLWVKYMEGDEKAAEELSGYLEYPENSYYRGTIYCHAGSTAEAYAIAHEMDYELIHFFKGDWTYDYDNMIRTRKCIHCDELETEPLESTNNGDVEIIEPVDPDTDFEVDKIEGDNFLLIEEKVTNGIEGNVEAEVLKAFDINLKNSDGVHVQPDGSVKVKLPNDWSKSGIYKVYRVNDDGTLTDMNAYREGSHLVFDTDHFSVYVIVVENKIIDTSNCNCICHKSGWFFETLTIVFRFVTKLLGVFPICDCGMAHY